MIHATDNGQQTTDRKKTGLAGRMRAWMKGRNRPWSARMLCEGLGAETWDEAQKTHNALGDFLKRGEIFIHTQPNPPRRRAPGQERKRRQTANRYKYNHAWRRVPKGKNKAKVLKAMYVSATAFAAADIERLSGANRNHVEKIIKGLVVDGALNIVGRRTCAAGVGAEQLYNIADRTQFRVEIMG